MDLGKSFKKSYDIPYEDGLTYPSLNTAREAVALFCAHEGFPYEFNGISGDGIPLVTINGIPHEILREIRNRGGYSIVCREL